MKPRWYFFAWFAVLAAVHLAIEGWTDTAAIGLPVGFAATLVLVFVPRLPWWATGEARPDGRRGVLRACLLVLWVLVAAALVDGLVEHPPHGADLVYAGVFVSFFAGASLYGLAKLLPERPSTRRVLRGEFVLATAAVWAVGAFALAAEVAAVVVTGGWLPWVLPVPSVVAVLALAVRRADLAVPVRCLASGSWTPVTAAAFDVRPGEPVDGWAVLPGDVRIRFHLPPVPADVAAELRERRRLWLAGWPSEDLVTGLPDGTATP
ncbi:hypothetical protein [Amycolatopsis sp. Hca4]|uniref:hypothetical protein n=1 Tax=Amycolatopsis sp. Hca4 TaxID=2742131 RepID=UPI001591D68B|nr:hypothetical protein [Amycolatopsis sp. Hca4]QKV77913.1 hypothetical protein HUT10_32090 [Amycolatopsis sp. Hca4]